MIVETSTALKNIISKVVQKLINYFKRYFSSSNKKTVHFVEEEFDGLPLSGIRRSRSGSELNFLKFFAKDILFVLYFENKYIETKFSI